MERQLPFKPHTPNTPQSGATVDRGGLPSAQADLAHHGPHLVAPLEKLPPEIRRQLLTSLRLAELKALAHASPVFHQQYHLDRRYILCSSLEATLRGATVDACATYRSGLAEFAETRSRDTVTRTIETYRDRRSATQYSIFDEGLTESEIVGMAAFHASIIVPLAQDYTRWTLADLAEKTKGQPDDKPLTATEEIRLIRAMYRFQLACNLFGRGLHRATRGQGPRFKSLEILKLFVCMFEPWEVEEIACIYCFASETYDQIFHKIFWDVHRDNPRFKDLPPSSRDRPLDIFESGSFISPLAFSTQQTYSPRSGSDTLGSRHRHLNGTVSRGLSILSIFRFKIRSHRPLVSTTQSHIEPLIGFFLRDHALSAITQYYRRKEGLSERDRMQQRREPMPFRGDDGGGPPRPPLAWTWMWGGTYSNIYGYCIGDEIRRWGYVMWDAARLERAGAERVLRAQWRAEWLFDPRDDPTYLDPRDEPV